MTGQGSIPVIGFVNNLVRRHLEWLHRAATARTRLSLVIAIFLIPLAILSIASIRFESDIFKLFPAKEGPIRLFLETLEWTGGAEEAYFLLEGDREKLTAAADEFASRLKAISVGGEPAFRSIRYRVFDPAEADPFADFIGYAVARPQLFLAADDVDGFLEKLEPSAMEGALKRARTELASQLGMSLRTLIAADPLYLRELILPRLKKGSRSLDLAPDSPYFLSRDGRLLIITAETARPVNDMAFARSLVVGINKARADFPVTVSCAGAHLSAVIDEAVMKRNILACILSSLLVVLGLFYFTYRRLAPTLLLPLIILYGTVMAMGCAGLFIHSLHIISFAFTALIIGLGTDYSIHIYDRYYWERSRGTDGSEALRKAVIETGHGVFTAAVTTALPFLALTLSDVRALSELGLLVGLGVIFTMYATFLFLPPLLILGDRRSPQRVYHPLPAFCLGRAWRLVTGHRRLVMTAALLVTGISLWGSFAVSFEEDLKNLQPRHSEALLTQEKIERHLSLAPKQMIVAVDGRDLDEAMARGAGVGAVAESYRRRGEIASLSWIGSVVNDKATQGDVCDRLRSGLGGRRPERDLESGLARAGFDPSMFRQAGEGLAGLANIGPQSPAEGIERLAASPLRGIAERFVVQRGGLFHLLFFIDYRGDLFPRDRFLKELAAAEPTARATGTDLVGSQLAELVRHSFVRGFALGGVLVLFLLLVHFGSLSGIGSALAPVLAGVLAMLGIMAALGMSLNFMNSMVLVTILGMGSDYGLHIHHRLRGGGEAEESFIQAGRGVLLSALTTIAGFGSLAFTDYGAMSSIGWATNFGVAATAIFALLALPAFLGRR